MGIASMCSSIENIIKDAILSWLYNLGWVRHVIETDPTSQSCAMPCCPSHERGGEGEECIIEASESLFQERSEP